MRLRLLSILLVAALLAAGCGRNEPISQPDQPALLQPQRSALANLGFPELATKNTTRVAGTSPAQTAAGVLRAVYPDADRPPKALTLIDGGDWRVAIAAAALTASPIGAPVLFGDGSDLPPVSQKVLDTLKPPGSKAAGNAQIIRVGNVDRPSGYKTTDLSGATPLALTRAIAGLIVNAGDDSSPRVIVTSADDSGIAAPAASYAAKSGDPVLFVNHDSIPPETRAALSALDKPRIYLLGPSTVISPKVSSQLRRIGTVQRYGGPDPVRNAIAASRYIDGAFGWGVVDAGHGLVFARAGRPLDAVAASALSASGTYGPLLLLDGADNVSNVLAGALLDIQPAYSVDPVRGVYNHGWIIGDRKAISLTTQAKLDALLEITRVHTPENPPQP